MTIELETRITVEASLAEILADAERVLGSLPHDPFVVDSAVVTSDIQVGPFEVAERGIQRYKDDYTIWKHGYLRISTGPISAIWLSVAYIAYPREREPLFGRPTIANEEGEHFGYQATVDAGGYRTRASFCFAALLISTIAARNRSRIVDHAARLKHGGTVDPTVITNLFAKHRGSASFEELADAFCDEIGFAPEWARAAEELARHRS